MRRSRAAPSPALVLRPRPLRQGLGHPEDDRDGRPQLVAEPGDLLVATLGSLDERLVGSLEFRGALSLALEGLRQLVDHGGRDLGGDDGAAVGGLVDEAACNTSRPSSRQEKAEREADELLGPA